MWYLILYVPPCMTYMVLTTFCFRAGRRIKIALLLYCVIASYGITRSKEVRVIWDVCPMLLFYPYLRHYFWESINNHAQTVGEQEWMISLSFHPLFLLQIACEKLFFPLVVKECMFLLCLVCLLGVIYTMFRVKKDISRRVIQRSALSRAVIDGVA